VPIRDKGLRRAHISQVFVPEEGDLGRVGRRQRPTGRTPLASALFRLSTQRRSSADLFEFWGREHDLYEMRALEILLRTTQPDRDVELNVRGQRFDDHGVELGPE
jgi:hypothetical protein